MSTTTEEPAPASLLEVDRDLDNIILHNHKGGSGKTTLAVHLVLYLAEHGEDVVLLDLDEQDNAIRWVSRLTWDGSDAIRVDLDTPGDILCVSEHAEYALEVAEKIDARLVVDTPPTASIFEDMPAVLHPTERDLFIIPATGRMSLDGAVSVLEEIEVRGFETRPRMIVNQTDPKDGPVSVRKIESVLALEDRFTDLLTFRAAIPRNEKFEAAEGHARAMWEIPYADRTYSAQALRAACGWIVSGAGIRGIRGDTGPDKLSKDLQQRLWI